MAATTMMRSADLHSTSSQNFYSADNSPQTPPSTNNSPTNQYSHLHVRQLRPPKQPLYTPACLRPTESLSRPKNIPDRPRAPDTPPESQESSFENGSTITGSVVQSPSHSSPIQISSTMPAAFGEDADGEFLEEATEITGPPTIAHWKPNASAASCSICKTPFTWYFRRHHCRRCGDLVCASHFLRAVPLDQNARLHRRGTKSKACDTCFREWQNLKALHSRTSSITDSQGSLRSPVPVPHHTRQNAGHHVGSMARSEGMVWSTF